MPDLPPTCLYCFKPLVRQRSTKKFCDDSCRNQYNLLSVRIETLIESSLTSLRTAQDLVSEHPEFADHARPMIETLIDQAKKARPRKPYTRKKDDK